MQFSKSQLRKPDATRKCGQCVQMRLQQGAMSAGAPGASAAACWGAQQAAWGAQQAAWGQPAVATGFGTGFGGAAVGAGGFGFAHDGGAPMECEVDDEMVKHAQDTHALAKFASRDPRALTMVRTALVDTGNDVTAAMQQLLAQQGARKRAKQGLRDLLAAKPEYQPSVKAALNAHNGDYLAAWKSLRPALKYLADCQKAYGHQGQTLVQQAFAASGMDAVKAAHTVQGVLAQQTAASPPSPWAATVATAA